MAEVEYRDVPEYLGYLVGDDGSVWSSWERVPSGTLLNGRRSRAGGVWKPMSHTIGTGGYVVVRLGGAMPPKTHCVHALVLTAFRGPRPTGMYACHADGERTNPTLSNLRWDTPKNNAADKVRHGTTNRGERCGTSRLTSQDVKEIRDAYASGVLQRVLAERYGVSGSHISDIVNYKRWAYA